jgi:hypothetical protein
MALKGDAAGQGLARLFELPSERAKPASSVAAFVLREERDDHRRGPEIWLGPVRRCLSKIQIEKCHTVRLYGDRYY